MYVQICIDIYIYIDIITYIDTYVIIWRYFGGRVSHAVKVQKVVKFFVLIYEVNDHEQALLQSNSTVVVATETEKFFPGSSAEVP